MQTVWHQFLTLSSSSHNLIDCSHQASFPQHNHNRCIAVLFCVIYKTFSYFGGSSSSDLSSCLSFPLYPCENPAPRIWSAPLEFVSRRWFITQICSFLKLTLTVTPAVSAAASQVCAGCKPGRAAHMCYYFLQTPHFSTCLLFLFHNSTTLTHRYALKHKVQFRFFRTKRTNLMEVIESSLWNSISVCFDLFFFFFSSFGVCYDGLKRKLDLIK